MEAEILTEIKEEEKKAEELLEKAKREKDTILQDAAKNSSKLLSVKSEEMSKQQEKKLEELRDQFLRLKQEKLTEGRNSAKQLKAKTEKNIPKAVEHVLKAFEEAI